MHDKKKLCKSKFSASRGDFSPPGGPDVAVNNSFQSKGGIHKYKSKHGKDVSFSSFARAIERGETEFIGRALDMALIHVDFRDMMSGTSILHVAARYPHARVSMEKFLRHPHVKSLIDATDNCGATPLIVAVWYENSEAVRLLLQNGAKTRTPLHECGQTALHIASTLKDPSILEQILEWNDSPCFLNWFDKSGNTALLTSAKFDTKCSEYLLKSGANHRAKNKKTGRNILHLAVLYQRKDLLEFLVTAFPEIPFITTLDFNGDSPLKLSLELKDAASATILVKSIAGEKLVAEFPDSLILATKIGKEELFDHVLKFSNIKKASYYYDENGETALAVAVSDDRVDLVKKLLKSGVKPTVVKSSCTKSIVDSVIVNLSNVHMTKLFLDVKLEELGDISDGDIKALYESTICRSSLLNFIAFRQSVLFDRIDNLIESPLFTAARMGNYGALLFLLLSKDCSQKEWISLKSSVPSENDLLRLYLKQEIYASDVFIFTGALPENSSMKFHPLQAHLFRNNKEDRNIFHACALGGCLDMVIFVYKYFESFYPKQCQKLDKPDSTGSTPLLLAILNKSEDVAAYLVQKGANLIKGNYAGENPIRAIMKHIPDHKNLLIQVMTQCIVDEQSTVKGRPKHHLSFSLHLYLLCPKDVKCITDVGYEICKLNYYEYQDILRHPLLDYFVWHLWEEVGLMMRVRFYIATTSTVLFSLYVTVKYCDVSGPTLNTLSAVLWWLSLWFAKFCLLFHLPICYVYAHFGRRLLLLSTVLVPLMEIIYLVQFTGDDRTSLEFGGTALLASWLNLLFHGVATPSDGVRIVTFWIVFQELCTVIPTFFIVTCAFTLYFFTLFNGHVSFTNPMHVFLFTAFQLPLGSIDVVPSLVEEQDYESHISTNSTAAVYSVLNGTVSGPLKVMTEFRTMLVEGVTLLAYLLIATALTNMLTALAIRAGENHLMAAQAKTIARKMGRIHEWEEFVTSKFHTFLSKCKALWVVGVHPNLKKSFVVPQVIHPLKTQEGYDIFRMKAFLTKKEDLISNKKVPYLLKLLERESV